MSMTAGPTVVRRQLGRALKRLRNAAQVSVDQVVARRELGISRAKLYKLEAGQHPVKPQDIVVLCQYFGGSKEEASRLTALALATQGQADAAIPEWFHLYRDLEQIASRIRTYDSDVIPGPLQTADYARAVFRASPKHTDEEAIGHQVALRLERQERLFAHGLGPRLIVVLNEAVLVRPFGGEDVLKAQVEHLRALDQRADVEVGVLPFVAGAYAATEGAFRILDFDDPDDPNIVYLEAHVAARYLQKPDEYAAYQDIWQSVHQQSVPLKEFSP